MQTPKLTHILIYTTLGFCLLAFSFPAMAEELKIKLKGQDLKKIAAFEIKLEYTPNNAFILEDSFNMYSSNSQELNDNDLLFKMIDTDNALIRVFFAKPLTSDELNINANLKRSNYTGQASVKIISTNFISDFSENIDPSQIKSSLELIENEEELPYMGISKAEILGPRERIFAKNMFISISNIETYGFVCDKSIKHPRINGQEAKFLNNKIIATNLKLDTIQFKNDLEIILELDVDGQTISKKVGTIHFIEAN